MQWDGVTECWWFEFLDRPTYRSSPNRIPQSWGADSLRSGGSRWAGLGWPAGNND